MAEDALGHARKIDKMRLRIKTGDRYYLLRGTSMYTWVTIKPIGAINRTGNCRYEIGILNTLPSFLKILTLSHELCHAIFGFLPWTHPVHKAIDTHLSMKRLFKSLCSPDIIGE